jgi:hypothetical protein
MFVSFYTAQSLAVWVTDVTSLKIPSLVVFQGSRADKTLPVPGKTGSAQWSRADLETRSRHVKEGLLAVIAIVTYILSRAGFGIFSLFSSN